MAQGTNFDKQVLEYGESSARTSDEIAAARAKGDQYHTAQKSRIYKSLVKGVILLAAGALAGSVAPAAIDIVADGVRETGQELGFMYDSQQTFVTGFRKSVADAAQQVQDQLPANP